MWILLALLTLADDAPASMEGSSMPAVETAATADATAAPPADMLGGGTIARGVAGRAGINGGIGILRGYFGFDGELLVALSKRVDLGVHVRMGFSAWVAGTPSVKLRAALLLRETFGLAFELTAGVPLVSHPGFGFSAGAAVEPGVTGHWQFSESTRLIFALIVQPTVFFDMYPSGIATYIGITPRLGIARTLTEGVQFYLAVDVTPTIDLSSPVSNPQMPLFGLNVMMGATFGS